MSLVYRVEHLTEKNGKTYSGPYHFSQNFLDIHNWASANTCYHGDNEHPEPFEEEGIINKLSDYPNWADSFYCAFSSIDQLKSWFSETERLILKGFGFIIATYEYDEIIIGHKQVLYKPKLARINISDLE